MPSLQKEHQVVHEDILELRGEWSREQAAVSDEQTERLPRQSRGGRRELEV